MNLTGHPFIDVGYAIAAVTQKKSSIAGVTSDDLIQTLVKLEQNLSPYKGQRKALNELGVMSSFWMNTPFAGNNWDSSAWYHDTMKKLLSENPKLRSSFCQVCGASGVFGEANRSWFPLSASTAKDACTFPNLSGKLLCPDCFRAVLVLPLGCDFGNSGPFLFHLVEPDLLVEAVERKVEKINSMLVSKATKAAFYKEPNKLKGRVELLEIVSGSNLWDKHSGGFLSRRVKNGATLITFSNAGDKAVWHQLHLPAQALTFFAALAQRGLKSEFVALASDGEKYKLTETKTKQPYINDLFERLCEDIEKRRSIAYVLLRHIKARKNNWGVLLPKEKQMLETYETFALDKKDRFDTLASIAQKVKEMNERPRESFIKRLGRLQTSESLLSLLKDLGPLDDPKLRLSFDEIRMLSQEKNALETICLLYLLCVAKD